MARRYRTIAAVVFAVGIVTAGVISLKAQSTPGIVANDPFSKVFAKLDQILAILTAPRESGSVVLSTPLVSVAQHDMYDCLVKNAGTEAIARVDVRMVNAFGGTLASWDLIRLAPGRADRVGYGSFGVGITIGCEFSFEGTAAAVRANLVVTNEERQTLVSAEAR